MVENHLPIQEKLTRQQLRELETKEKTPLQKVGEGMILCLPLVCGGVAVAEYLLIADNSMDPHHDGGSLLAVRRRSVHHRPGFLVYCDGGSHDRYRQCGQGLF